MDAGLPDAAAENTGPEPDWAASHEAVRAAEQAVGDAWIGLLLLAESETQAIAEACDRARARAADRVRTARRAGGLAGLARSQTDLELADAARGRALEVRERAHARLARELPVWSEATSHRVRQSLSDELGAGR